MFNIGIIGYGSIGERHFNNIRKLYPKSHIKILTQREKILPHRNTEVFSSKKLFFNQPIDIFFITNETYKHADTIIECFKYSPRGIFVEKPLSHNLRNLEKIKREISARKTIFFVGYCLQFYKPLLEIKKIIHNKTIGDVIYMRVSVGQDLRTWRKRNYKDSYSYEAGKGGGSVLDLIHEINYPAWLLDEEISFICGSVFQTGLFDIESEDISEGIFVSESGKLVSLHQDYLQATGRRYCEIVGTKGTMIWDSLIGKIKVILSDGRSNMIGLSKNDMYTNELKFFMNKVEENKRFNNFDEAFKDVKNAIAFKKKHV